VSAPVVKFKTSRWTWRNDSLITLVECARETESSVFISEPKYNRVRREAKVSDNHQYHDTWAAARSYLVAKETTAVTDAEDRLKEAQEKLAKALEIPEAQP
jgi:hypothetical protein